MQILIFFPNTWHSMQHCLSFWLSASLTICNFSCGGVGGGGIDLNMNVTSAWTCIFFNWKTGQNIFVFKINYSDKWLWMKSQAKCKLTQQLLTLLGQQCCKLLCPCWQWCANACNNVGTCTSIERRMQPLRLWRPWHGNAYASPLQCWKSCANGSNIVAFHFSDQLTEQKKCWELSAQNFDRFQALHNNCQQHATTRNIQQCWELLTNNVEFIWTGPYTEK